MSRAVSGRSAPPEPGNALTYDDLSERLRALRAWAGTPYREVHRRVVCDRKARGVAELPVYNAAYQEAFAIVSDLGDPFEKTILLVYIADAHDHLGDAATALDELRHGLELARELGFRLAESDALQGIGVVYAGLERYDEALAHHEEALAIALDDGVREIELWARNGKGTALRGSGRVEDGLAQHRKALALAQELGDRYGLACAHDGIGRCFAALGDVETARTHRRFAHTTHAELGTPEAAEVAERLHALG